MLSALNFDQPGAHAKAAVMTVVCFIPPLLLLLGAASNGVLAQQDDGVVNLQQAIPDGYFNAAYQKPVLADSTYMNSADSCGGGDGDDCTADLAVDGFTGDHHRWLSSFGPGDDSHWLVVDLQDDFWVQQVNLFTGRDRGGADGEMNSDHPLCSYHFDYYSGQSHTGPRNPYTGHLTPEFASSDNGWATVFTSDQATLLESHNDFPGAQI